MSKPPRLAMWLASQPWRSVMRPIMKGRATIFVLHRVHAPQSGVRGHSLSYIGNAVDALRASGAEIVPLRLIVEAHTKAQPGNPNWVALTIDDGFADQYQMCREVLVPRGCPATCFPVTDFLDGKLWPWDDRLGWAFEHSPLQRVELNWGRGVQQLDLNSPSARLTSLRIARSACKQLPGYQLFDTVEALAAQLRVQIPAEAPPQHSAMTWTQARELESSGIEFGIHTSTHRIVSRLDELSLQQELQTSWQRVQSELASPLPVVSWPTGLPGDYTPRDESIAVRLGIEAGVSSAGDYALVGGHDGPPAFTLARFGLPSSISRVLQQGSWIERGKQIVRRH